MKEFAQWFEDRHRYAREWKRRTGGKVMGYFCTYVPEEILYAANILPVRIVGSHEPATAAEPYMYSGLFCPFSRNCLSQGIKGRYDYLDGIMIAQSCLGMRLAFWAWQKYMPVDYYYYLMMPHGIQTTGRYKYMGAELAAFKESIEKWIGKTITNEDLDRGIEIMNANRRLMRDVYEFRKMDDPPLTGLEAMEVSVSDQMVDKQEHSQALRELLKELPNRKFNRETGTRLMFIGGGNNDCGLIRMLEEGLTLPATVVIEEHCTGSRYFWNEVVPQEDRLMAIGVRYIDRVPCPSKDWPEKSRFSHILNLAKEYNVEEVIIMRQKFCEPHELDMPDLRKTLDNNGYPTYFFLSGYRAYFKGYSPLTRTK